MLAKKVAVAEVRHHRRQPDCCHAAALAVASCHTLTEPKFFSFHIWIMAPHTFEPSLHREQVLMDLPRHENHARDVASSFKVRLCVVISMLVIIAKQKRNNSISVMEEGRLVDKGGV